MSRFGVSKEIEFDAGHRVPDHEGKCSSPHGHRYRIVLYVVGDLQAEGSARGMVLDFADIKKVLQEIHDKFDHGFIYCIDDDEMRHWALNSPPHWKWVEFPESPTAENLARWCFEYALGRFTELELAGAVVGVEVWETPTSCAHYPAQLS